MKSTDLLPSTCKAIGFAVLQGYSSGTLIVSSDFQDIVHDAYQGENKDDIMPCGYGGLRTKHAARWVLNSAKHQGILKNVRRGIWQVL